MHLADANPDAAPLSARPGASAVTTAAAAAATIPRNAVDACSKYCVGLDSDVDRAALRADVARAYLNIGDCLDTAVDTIISLSRMYPVQWNERYVVGEVVDLDGGAATAIRSSVHSIASTWPADCHIRLTFDRLFDNATPCTSRVTVTFALVRGAVDPSTRLLGTDTNEWKQHAQTFEDIARLYPSVTPLEMAKLCRVIVEKLATVPHRWRSLSAMGAGGAKHGLRTHSFADSDACALGDQLRNYYDCARGYYNRSRDVETSKGATHLDVSVERDGNDLVVLCRVVLSDPPTHTTPRVQSPHDLHALYPRALPAVLATLAQIDGRLYRTVPHVWVERSDPSAPKSISRSTCVMAVECTAGFVDDAVSNIDAVLRSGHLPAHVDVAKRHVILCFDDAVSALVASVVVTSSRSD